MTRALITILGDADRKKIANWAWGVAKGSRVEFKAPQRSLDQNSRMWAMLTDVAQQVDHIGRRYTPDQWKVLFMHACGREVQFLPALDGATFIPWGQSSSDLSKHEMSELIDFIGTWGAEHGVVFHDREQAA